MSDDHVQTVNMKSNEECWIPVTSDGTHVYHTIVNAIPYKAKLKEPNMINKLRLKW